MKKQEKTRANDLAHCPKCNANAVEPCHKPEAKDCPRGDERKKG